MKKTSTRDMTRAEWLELRRKGLGGSDMGAVLGMNEYRGPYAVWLEKTGRYIPEDKDSEPMRIGRDLEEYVARRFTEASGKKVRKLNAICTSDEYPHIQINIDRDVVGENAVLECKTANAYGGSKFADEIPDSYYAQCVTYMAVTGADRCYLAALIMGMDFKIYILSRTDMECPEWAEKVIYVAPEEFEGIKNAAADFWRYVEEDAEPPVDGSRDTTDAISEIYPYSAEDKEIDCTLIETSIEIRQNLKKQKDELEKEIKYHDNVIKNFLKDAEKGSCSKFKVSYKSAVRTNFDSKAFKKDHPEICSGYENKTEYRTLRITERK